MRISDWSSDVCSSDLILSVATGLVKASELDGSRSYIGGYNHEAPFSVALVTFFIVASFATGLRRWVKFELLALICTGIALANYRTSLNTLIPFAAFYATHRNTPQFRPSKPFVPFTAKSEDVSGDATG